MRIRKKVVFYRFRTVEDACPYKVIEKNKLPDKSKFEKLTICGDRVFYFLFFYQIFLLNFV